MLKSQQHWCIFFFFWKNVYCIVRVIFFFLKNCIVPSQSIFWLVSFIENFISAFMSYNFLNWLSYLNNVYKMKIYFKHICKSFIALYFLCHCNKCFFQLSQQFYLVIYVPHTIKKKITLKKQKKNNLTRRDLWYSLRQQFSK